MLEIVNCLIRYNVDEEKSVLYCNMILRRLSAHAWPCIIRERQPCLYMALSVYTWLYFMTLTYNIHHTELCTCNCTSQTICILHVVEMSVNIQDVFKNYINWCMDSCPSLLEAGGG